MRYLYIAQWSVWRSMWSRRYPERRIGLFRNLPHVKPGRWGVFLLGLEIGSRNPRDPVGVWLKSHGLYPW
jgi:hypothetical protein